MDPVDVIFSFSVDARLCNPTVAFVCIAWPHLCRARELVVLIMLSFSSPLWFEEAKEGEGRVRFLVLVASHGYLVGEMNGKVWVLGLKWEGGGSLFIVEKRTNCCYFEATITFSFLHCLEPYWPKESFDKHFEFQLTIPLFLISQFQFHTQTLFFFSPLIFILPYEFKQK